MIKYKIAKLEDVPEGLRSEYKKAADGSYVLDTDVNVEQLNQQALTAEQRAAQALQANTTQANQVQQLQAQLEATTKAQKDFETKYQKAVLDQHFTTAFTKGGGIPEAAEFASQAFAKVFQIDPATGNVVAKGQDGKPVLSPKGTPITPEEWVSSNLAKSSPFLFKPSTGGGAGTGGTGGGGFSGPNPYAKSTRNFTKAAELERTDPALAANLKAAAATQS